MAYNVSFHPRDYRRLGSKEAVPEAIIKNALIVAGRVRNGCLPILTLGHLAYLTAVPWHFLRRVISRRTKAYYGFYIPKRNGDLRLIHCPFDRLKRVQRFINQEILAKTQSHECAYGFHPQSSRPGSIKECAANHLGAKWLLKIDIKDFYHSISELAVYRVFLRLGYQPLVSLEMARLCTFLPLTPKEQHRLKSFPCYNTMHFGVLPQGAPTSPMLANLVCVNLDENIAKIADSFGLTFTRYADDLCFSTNDRNLDRRSALKFINLVRAILRKRHFKMNRKKTVIAGPGARKEVLGLYVDTDSVYLSRPLKCACNAICGPSRNMAWKVTCGTPDFVLLLGFITI